MALTIPAQFLTEMDKKGYSPVILIDFNDWLKFLSTIDDTDVEIERGTDGVIGAVNGNQSFSSASAVFQANGITTSDTLEIETGADAGSHTINSIDSETKITIGSGLSPASSLTYYIKRAYDGAVLAKGKSMSGFRRGVDMRGGLASVGKTVININNMEDWTDIFATFAKPENDIVTITLTFNDGTRVSREEGITLYTGVLQDFNLNAQSVSLQVKDNIQKHEKKIGVVITREDFSEAPADSIGKIKPIIYGDCRMNVGSRTVLNDYVNVNLAITGEIGRFVPMVLVDPHTDKYIIAGHVVDEVIDILALAPDGTLVELDSSGYTITNSGSECSVVIDTWKPNFHVMPIGFTNEDNSPDPPGDWVGGDNKMYDERIDTVVTSALLNADPINTRSKIDIVFNEWLKPDDLVVNLTRIVSRSGFTGITGNYNFDLSYSSSSKILKTIADTAVDIRTVTSPVSSNIANLSLKHEKLTLGGIGGSSTATFYQAWWRLECTLDSGNKYPILFASVKGREYGTWINSRTQSETHDDNGSANALIENFAGIIESVARDEMSLVDADINLDSFNIASNDLVPATADKKWYGAFFVESQESAFKLIDRLARNCKSFIWFDQDGKLKIKVRNGSAAFTRSGNASTAQNSDQFRDAPTVTGSAYDQAPIQKNSLKISRSPLSMIKNEIFNIWMLAKDEQFSLSEFVTGSDNSIGASYQTDASTSQTDYALTSRLNFNGEMISGYPANAGVVDNLSARQQTRYLIDFLRQRYYIIQFTTWLNGAWIEPGDIINIRHPKISSLIVSPNNKKWQVLSSNFIPAKTPSFPGGFNVTAMELWDAPLT